LVWIGSVTGYSGALDAKPKLDHGAEYPSTVDLALIQPVMTSECEFANLGELVAYRDYVHQHLPVGSRVADVRWQDLGGAPIRSPEEGFLHPVNTEGAPDLDARTVNESMALAGVALPDPPVGIDSDGHLSESDLGRARATMSALNFQYYLKIAEAYRIAYADRTGIVGSCATYVLAARERAQAREREQDERKRRFDLGPDGQAGTTDDQSDFNDDGEPDRASGTDPDGFVGGGGSGGSSNIPGRLCPTRFC
jgi:hypothetical protein